MTSIADVGLGQVEPAVHVHIRAAGEVGEVVKVVAGVAVDSRTAHIIGIHLGVGRVAQGRPPPRAGDGTCRVGHGRIRVIRRSRVVPMALDAPHTAGGLPVGRRVGIVAPGAGRGVRGAVVCRRLGGRRRGVGRRIVVTRQTQGPDVVHRHAGVGARNHAVDVVALGTEHASVDARFVLVRRVVEVGRRGRQSPRSMAVVAVRVALVVLISGARARVEAVKQALLFYLNGTKGRIHLVIKCLLLADCREKLCQYLHPLYSRFWP